MKARKALMGAVASKWEEQEEEDSLDGAPMGGALAAPIDARAEEERRQILRYALRPPPPPPNLGGALAAPVDARAEKERRQILRVCAAAPPPTPPNSFSCRAYCCEVDRIKAVLWIRDILVRIRIP
jgi:hypothetical protein